VSSHLHCLQLQGYDEILSLFDCKRAGRGFKYEVEWAGEEYKGKRGYWLNSSNLSSAAREYYTKSPIGNSIFSLRLPSSLLLWFA